MRGKASKCGDQDFMAPKICIERQDARWFCEKDGANVRVKKKAVILVGKAPKFLIVYDMSLEKILRMCEGTPGFSKQRHGTGARFAKTQKRRKEGRLKDEAGPKRWGKCAKSSLHEEQSRNYCSDVSKMICTTPFCGRL